MYEFRFFDRTRNYTHRFLHFLDTLLDTLIHRPIQSFRRLYKWYTYDFDIGYALQTIWGVWFIYLLLQLVNTYTPIFSLTVYAMFNSVDATIQAAEFICWFLSNYWPAIILIALIGLATWRYHCHRHRETHDLLWSYVDDEDDAYVSLPVNEPTGWGDLDPDVDPTPPDFQAPTIYVKISGMVALIPGLAMHEIITRINQSIKEKLGPYIWHKVTVDTRIAMVFVKFRNFQDSTSCFKRIDGLVFDGQTVGVLYVTEERYNQRFPPTRFRIPIRA
ncbi:hypothetical protein GCK72_015995 [Caenorhabditis remanei]|uniref:RRM domain-containing protein n=1 Tax=Caenorhabditis remanei TaxID=31234 RepID=A0A6A5GVM2_CAERE|nr:hypothetical protein GCK72_015995 [Caenorhabditis remanei]KAF1759528.1 hypothetical protein GCK72_015995 [Caenorhabditis remanei]